MEYNINSSSSVSMFKRQRKLNDGNAVWDSVVKLRKKNPAQCSKSPKNHLGMRNSWIKEFSNKLSDKASAYVLEAMSAERTSRQEEIAQTLLNKFNDFLEQEASMTAPKTLTHKAMVMMADKLSLWLDKNVKVSKSVGVYLRRMEAEEKKKRLAEEMERLKQEKRDREEERKRKLAEQLAKKRAEEKSAADVLQPPSDTEPEPKDPKRDEDQAPMKPATGDDEPKEEDGKPLDERQEDGQQPQDTEPQPPTPTTDPTDIGKETEEPPEGTQQILEDSQGPEIGGTSMHEDKDVKAENPDDINEQKIETEVNSDSKREQEKLDEGSSGEINWSSGEKAEIVQEGSDEQDIPPDSPLRNVLNIGDSQGSGEPEDAVSSNYPAPDVQKAEFETLGKTYTPSGLARTSPESFLPSSDSDFTDRDDINYEPSKDSDALVEEALGSAVNDEDLVDDQEDHGEQSVDDRTNTVLQELAEMIAATREEHSPLQEAIKDIMEKELEEKLGDKDIKTINEVAGKVGTWMDKMVERAGEEYGERRSPSRARSASPTRPKVSLGMSGKPELAPQMPGAVPQVSHWPSAVPQESHWPTTAVPQVSPRPPAHPQGPMPSAVSPEGLAKSSFETIQSSLPQPPVSQKPKGPIFELRKVDTKNIFNVAGISNTKAKRKIREARGLPTSSRPFSQESLDLEEWAEWAGLVSDVGQNWAKWVEDVAAGADRRDYNHDNNLSIDAREWQKICKGIRQEGDVWMKKVINKQNKKDKGKIPEAHPLSA